MNLEQTQALLSADVDTQLDQLLASWRQVRHLQPAQADRVRQAIMTTTTDLPADWWRNYANRMNRMMTQVINRTSTPRIHLSARSWPVAVVY